MPPDTARPSGQDRVTDSAAYPQLVFPPGYTGPWVAANAEAVVIEVEDLRALIANHDHGGCSYCASGRADLCRDKSWLLPLREAVNGE